jgi:prophage tail gpP-like protein
MPDFELFVGQRKLTSFTNGWVKRELDTAADSFEFQYADLRLRPGESVPIRAGDRCEIKLRGNTLLTGYVDDTSFQYSATSLTLTVRGRSKTGDLVDCSAVRPSGRWSNATLETIASNLCAPFGIDVTVDKLEGITDTFKRYAIEPGESCFDCIQRASRLRSAWATCTVDGGLHITRASTGRTAPIALEYGKNIISGERFDSWAQRHSAYLLKGQTPSDEELAGTASSQLAEYVVDEGLNRYRPLLLVSTGHDRKGDLKRRAQWERNRRAGTGERLLYRVDGYGYDSKEYVGQFKQHSRDTYRLWEPNMMVKVVDPRLEAIDWFLVAAVSYRWQAEGDDGGRTTDLTLTRKEAFGLQDYPRRTRAKVKDIAGWWYSPNNAIYWGQDDIGDILARGRPRPEPEPEWQGPPILSPWRPPE